MQSSAKFPEESKVEVRILQGTLRGCVATDFDGEKYFRFQGVPYAKPPMGLLRFKAPASPEKWSGVLDATKEGNPCYSGHFFDNSKVGGSEDCLYLNVYTKNIGDEILNPVMFYIHGGGFLYGSGGTEFYGPEFLLTEDVVVVTINYRLGLLGFLSFEDPSLEVPGNAGLKDMVMALKWVQNNIDQFGGDPKNVTIFGQSSGGMAVNLLMMSDMSRGLFAKAIAQSGCALSTYTRAKTGAEEVSKVLGIQGDGNIYNRLMEMTVEEIYQVQEKLDNFQTHVAGKPATIGYVVEKNTNVESFLIEDPLTILQRGNFCQVSFLTGFTTLEFIGGRPGMTGPGSGTCENLIPFFLGHRIGSEKSLTIAKKLRRFYFGSEDLSKVDPTKIPSINIDMAYLYELYLTVLYQYRQSQNLYLYRMSSDTKLNILKNYFKIKYTGAAHCDDIGYLFKNFLTPEIEPGSIEDLSMRRTVKLWTNFAKYGNPTPKYDPLLDAIWKPVTSEDVDFLEIGEKLVASKNPIEFKRTKFLKNVFEENAADTKLKASL